MAKKQPSSQSQKGSASSPSWSSTDGFITRREFDLRMERLRVAMEAESMALIGSTDLVGDVYASALAAWSEGRYRDPSPEVAQTAFAKWVRTILHNLGVSQVRTANVRRKYEATSLDDPTSRAAETLQMRWTSFALSLETNTVRDAELRHEARARLRLADLDAEETLCLSMRLDGKKGHEIALKLAELHPDVASGETRSQATVTRRIQSAVKKLRAVPDNLITSPDVDWYAWNIGCEVTLYTPPLRTGSGLDRERMRLSEAAFQRYGKREEREK